MRRLHGRHPLNVLPLGNRLLDSDSTGPTGRGARCGALSALRDEQLLRALQALDPASLARCAAAAPRLRAFALSDELWQPHVLRRFLAPAGAGLGETFAWRGRTWREAFVHSQNCAPAPCHVAVFSDVLYRSFFYAAGELQAAWLGAETLPRVSADLSVEDFLERFERRSCPVLIEGCVKTWPAMGRWHREALLQRFGDVPFAAGAADFPLRCFYEYAESNMDDVPMFIFDKYFGKRAPGLLEDYEVPEHFRGRDLFDLLGDRPDFRWLLIGHRRSGSKWHLDPNKTCAWNAVVRGRKRWLLLPPGCPPPGVHRSKDGAEVIQPVSLLEWFTNFYAELKRHVDLNPAWDLKEGTCGPGDLVFIPSGWWHCVLNLEDDTIAVTQNYASETHVASVRRFLSERREEVSGTADRETLAERFDEALARHRPDLLGEAAESEIVATKPEETPKFSFWDHLRSTGKSLSFEAKRQRLT
ncbi:unnamed protein product [Effrenium voratum]|uniref:JmjC domain-containing protein n=1 Tax=Effrenium voratum TaxID=2562239 RepID=A0AA36HM01_9DINO|nr:unnamed protein product [Effrenium voratum]